MVYIFKTILRVWLKWMECDLVTCTYMQTAHVQGAQLYFLHNILLVSTMRQVSYMQLKARFSSVLVEKR